MSVAKYWILSANIYRHSRGRRQIEPELKWIVVPAEDAETF